MNQSEISEMKNTVPNMGTEFSKTLFCVDAVTQLCAMIKKPASYIFSGILMHDGITFPKNFLFGLEEKKPVTHKLKDGVAHINFANDYYLGEDLQSTDNYANYIEDLKYDSDVKGLVMTKYSGGGVDVAGETMRTSLKSFSKKKPVIVHALTIGSAAYMGSLGANLIIAANGLSRVGSIGAYMSVPKYWAEAYPEYFEDIYADKSSEKNIAWRNYVESFDTKEYKAMANESAAYFIDKVKASRDRVEPEALTGKMYLAGEAKSLGLIDGIGDISYVNNRMKSLLKQY